MGCDIGGSFNWLAILWQVRESQIVAHLHPEVKNVQKALYHAQEGARAKIEIKAEIFDLEFKSLNEGKKLENYFSSTTSEPSSKEYSLLNYAQ
jgi:hypothetical protein